MATGGWLIADAVQPASYSPIRKTVSVLAGHAGTDRWIMTGALFLVGGCQLVTAVGLAGTGVPARILLAVAGLCSNRGNDLGLAERLFLSIETCWPFIVAVALRQTTG